MTKSILDTVNVYVFLLDIILLSIIIINLKLKYT